MKRLVLLFLYLYCSSVLYAQNNLIDLRILLEKSAKNKEYAELFFNKMSPITNDSSSILLAYKAISILVKGKHSYNPYTKLKYFYWGKDLLDIAIDREKKLELHYLRFAVQVNIPSFLPYRENIQEDKEIIFSYLPKTNDNDLITRIIRYLPTTKYCTEKEIKQLKL